MEPSRDFIRGAGGHHLDQMGLFAEHLVEDIVAVRAWRSVVSSDLDISETVRFQVCVERKWP